jgi:histidine decarboxylase
MWRSAIPEDHTSKSENQLEDFGALLSYIDQLACNKLGYPVSLLTYLGVLDNQILGIRPNSLANVLLNNVGDPFKDSETSLMEVKKHERVVISILEKFYGLHENEIRGYVTTGGTEGNFAGIWWSKRYLINTVLPSLVERDDKIKLQLKEEQERLAELSKISLNDYQRRAIQLQKILDIRNSISENRGVVQQLLTPTVFYTRGHTHYSIPKIAEILHLNIRPVEPNSDGSMSISNFKKELLIHLGAYPFSPVIVIANIGTTITGAIDDVPEIKKSIEGMQTKLVYTIHMDGALTGFVLPVLKPFGEVKNYFDAIGVNTLAVSAHKYPGLSQPCGIILARRTFFEKAFEKSERSIDYVGNIVDVTITGSRSGLNVLMFYNALRTLGLHKNTDKLKEMVQANLRDAKYLYDELVKIYGKDKVHYPYHFNVMFPKPSMTLAKKYQLMITGEIATICVLTNVNKELIDKFIVDLKIDKEITMTQQETKTDYQITTLKEEHIKSAAELFIKSFCESEPVTKHLNIHYKDYEPFAMEVLHKAAKEGMSRVAIDKHNKVIACAISEDIADPFIPHLAHYPKLKPVLALIEELSTPFTQGKKFHKGKIAHVWIAVVEPSYRGHGLSTEIDMACIEGAARKGFDYAYAEFTNAISENVTHHFKMLKLMNRIQYKDFKFNGEKPFAGLEGCADSYLATIRPGVKLESLHNCYQTTESSMK